ncbi:MAG TPA: hypothetical protein VFY29_13255 [Terriglobia bacterium]|nr:hypothetical protein [Terriglobia bacterium]
MQKWEYAVKTVSETTIMDQPEPGTRLQEHGNGLLTSDYGVDGWELISVLPSERGGLFHLFFKRPKTD